MASLGTTALGAAVGATFCLEPISTLDVDVFVTLESQPGALLSLSPIYEYLARRGFLPEGEHVTIGGWLVLFLPPASALEEEAVAGALSTDVDGVPARVMSAEHLVAIALKTGRAKDHLRILQFLESGILDESRLGSILARHGLLERWQRFKERYCGAK